MIDCEVKVIGQKISLTDSNGKKIGEFKTEAEVEKIKQEIETIRKKSGEEGVNRYIGDLQNEYNLGLLSKGLFSKKIVRVNYDLLDDLGNIIFRSSKNDIEKIIKFANKDIKERQKIINGMLQRRRQSKVKYNPKKAEKKGFNIPLSDNGTSPDFRGEAAKYLYREDSVVRIQLKGSRNLDYKEAFKTMGITDTKTMQEIQRDYVWHHLDDLDESLGCTMQLVRKDAHNATKRHFGSAGQAKYVFNLKKYL